MTPDDPRHGTTAGYHAGCRNPCCKAARARYEKEGRLQRLRGGRAIPAVGAQRRIRALMRLGWTSTDLATAAGWSNRNDVLRIVNGQKGKPTRWLERATDQAIRSVYDRLSMRTPPPSPCRARTRALAVRRGWASPLAWDDIDDPSATPQGVTDSRPKRAGIDEVAIQRRIHGDRSVQLHAGEAAEIVRRLQSAGWTLRRIQEHTGVNAHRYITREAVA